MEIEREVHVDGRWTIRKSSSLIENRTAPTWDLVTIHHNFLHRCNLLEYTRSRNTVAAEEDKKVDYSISLFRANSHSDAATATKSERTAERISDQVVKLSVVC